MWFAALGHYKENPWLVNLAYHLLYNVEPGTQFRLLRNPRDVINRFSVSVGSDGNQSIPG